MNHSSSENSQTIDNVSAKLDAQLQRKPRAPFDWRWWAGLSVTLLVTALVASIVVFGFVIPNRTQQSDDIETCRARYATRVTDAQVSNDVAVDDIVLFLSTAPEDRNEQRRGIVIANLQGTRLRLDVARDNRLEYEKTLTLPCPIEALSSREIEQEGDS